jgi:hypothetical protein
MFYETKGKLVIDWSQVKGQHLVTLKGDAGTKVLYRGDNIGQAKKVYVEVQSHYKKQDEDANG